jgi:NADH-ubiquinone oxidoreductase chain 6
MDKLYLSDELMSNNLYSSLYLLNEVVSNNLHSSFLVIISLLSILTGISVIISKNPIVSVLFLIGLFLTIAVYLMILGISFIGLSYLLVYVGAVSILFLFILMLINVRISEVTANSINSIPLSTMIGIFFLISLGNSFSLSGIINTQLYSINNSLNIILESLYNLFNSKLFFAISQVWDGKLAETSHITTIGNIIYTNFPLLILLTSIILLLSMIGSILITIKQ